MALGADSLIIRLAGTFVVVSAAVKAAVSMARIMMTSAPDFPYYYQAGGEFFGAGHRSIHILPPVSRFVYAPLALMPYPVAQAVWVAGSMAALVIVLAFVRRMSGARIPLPLLWALAYVAFPTQFTLGMGQVNLIALLLITSAVWLEMRRRAVLGGMVLAGAVLLKPELLLILPVFLLTRSVRLLGVAVAAIAAAVGVSVGMWGLGDYAVFIEKVSPVFRDSFGWGIYYNQSLSSVLARRGVVGSGWFAVASALVLGITVLHLMRSKAPLPRALWVYLPAFLLIEPIAWQHHLVFLIPTYVWLSCTVRGWGRTVALAVSYVLVSWNFAAPGFLDTIPLGWLAASHGTLGIALVWMLALENAYET